jgi:hypothetical protein
LELAPTLGFSLLEAMNIKKMLHTSFIGNIKMGKINILALELRREKTRKNNECFNYELGRDLVL